MRTERNRTVQSRTLYYFNSDLTETLLFFFFFLFLSPFFILFYFFFYLLSLNVLDHHHINSCMFHKHNHAQLPPKTKIKNQNKRDKTENKTKTVSIILLSVTTLQSAPYPSNSTRFRNGPCRFYEKFLNDYHYVCFSFSV